MCVVLVGVYEEKQNFLDLKASVLFMDLDGPPTKVSQLTMVMWTETWTETLINN